MPLVFEPHWIETMGTKDTFTDNLKASNCFFKSIIDLVPPGAFFDADANQKITAHHAAVAQKDASQNSKHGEKLKQKKVKFDPNHPSKTSELQQLLPTLNDESGEESDGDEGGELGEAGSSSEDNDEENSATKDSRDVSVKKTVKPTKLNNVHPAVVSDSPSTSAKKKLNMKAKKHKLLANDKPILGGEDSNNKATNSNFGGMNGDIDHADHSGPASSKKVKLSKSNEPTYTSSENSSGPSPITVQPRLDTDQLREKLRARITELQAKRQHGMTAEEFMESKKLRRKESKLKLKQKRKEAKKLKLSVEKQAKNSQNKLNGVSEVKKDPDENANNNNKMVFSKFQFSEQAQKKRKDKKQKKSYKDLYEKVR